MELGEYQCFRTALDALVLGLNGGLMTSSQSLTTDSGTRGTTPSSTPATALSITQDTSDHERRSTAVTFETTDFKVTAACASGWTESAHLEMAKYRLECVLRAADKDQLKEGETPLEDNVLLEVLEDGERSAGSHPQGTRRAACRNRVSWHLPLGTITAKRSRTSDYGTDSDDQYETCFSDTSHPKGTRPSRRSPQKQTRHFLTLMNLKPAEVETKAVLASGRYREEAAETTPSWPPMPVMIVLFAMVMFVIFMRVINGC